MNDDSFSRATIRFEKSSHTFKLLPHDSPNTSGGPFPTGLPGVMQRSPVAATPDESSEAHCVYSITLKV